MPYERVSQSGPMGEGRSIYQAPNGLMWFGMKPAGLVYYNGESLEQFPLEGAEDFTATEEVFIVGENVLYLNFKKEVKIFDPLAQQIIGTIKPNENILTDEAILHLDYTNVHGEPLLWAALPPLLKNEQKYYRILLSKNHQPFEWVTDGEIPLINHSVMEPIEDGLIVSTGQKFLMIDQTGQIIKTFSLTGYNLSNLREREFATNHKNKLAITVSEAPQERATFGFSIRGEDLVQEFEEIKTNYWGRVRLEMNDKLLFINGLRAGIRKLDGYKKKHYLYINDAGTGGSAYTTYLDSMGTYWLGNTRGIGKRYYSRSVFKKYDKLKKNRMITEDEKGNIYVGTEYRYLKILNPVSDYVYGIKSGSTTSFSVINHLGEIYCNDVKIVGRETEKLSISGIEAYTLASLPTIQLVDRNDRLWSAEWWRSAIILADLKTNQVIQEIRIPELADSQVEYTYLYQRPSDGTIWLGTNGNGAFVYSESGEFLARYTASPKSSIVFKSNIVNCFYEDEQDRLWIGHGKGLSCLNSMEESIRHFEINTDEPENNLVTGILPEEGTKNHIAFLWLSTQKGIYRFDIQTGLSMGFPLHEDLMNTKFNATSFYKAKNGRMYFGAFNNFFAFFPEKVMAYYDRMRVQGSNLPILINQFSKFDRETNEVIEPIKVVHNMETIELRDGDRYFDLSFTVADFRRPKENFYTYKLEGYDEKWRKPSKSGNHVHYENLPSGTYTLRMRGGLFKSSLPYNEKQLEVIVLPPWYQTWWAYLIFTLTGLGIIVFVYQFQLNRQLEKAENRQIKEMDELKTQFYSNITHEFRTPLTVMLGVSENISGHEKERRLLQRNGYKLLRLINQLLDLSKLESHKLEVNFIQDDVLPYLQYLAESFSSMAESKGIKLAFISDLLTLVMDYDEEKIQQIVYNLLSNAIKFTDKGGQVVIEAQKWEGGEVPMLNLKVRDNGIGIAPDQLPFIFDRFYQADSSVTRKGEGTGIGLAFTKELVQLLGGTIHVKSEQGKGSIFTIALPISNKALNSEKNNDYKQAVAPQYFQDLDETAISLVPKAAQDQSSLPTEQSLVLVVEDNRDVIAYIESLLASEYQIIKATNGQEGIDQAIERMPDIIISDVMMPEKDGYELCATLKNDERTSHIPIILLTAKVAEQDRFTGLRQGADAYLAKPFNKEELFIRLEKLLELRRKLQISYAQTIFSPKNFVPTQSKKLKEPSLDDLFLQKIRQIIDDKIGDPDLDIPYLCQSVGLSTAQLFRKMKALTGEAPISFIRRIRLHRAKELLQSTDLSIAEIAYDSGFTDPNYFSRAFKKEFGEAPSKVWE